MGGRRVRLLAGFREETYMYIGSGERVAGSGEIDIAAFESAR